MRYICYVLEITCIFAVMKKVKKRRIWVAWMLLTVFMSMLLMSSLHHHESISETNTECYECQHHVHHSGHFTTTSTSVDNCVLCQFLTLPFIAATTLVVALLIKSIHSKETSLEVSLLSTFVGKISERGPPALASRTLLI